LIFYETHRERRRAFSAGTGKSCRAAADFASLATERRWRMAGGDALAERPKIPSSQDESGNRLQK
jgi:hypothetical protein